MKQSNATFQIISFFFFSFFVALFYSKPCIGQDKAFSIDPTSKWEIVQNSNSYVAKGNHQLEGEHYIWIFLVDGYGRYYMQYPPVVLLEEGIWEASNISPGNNIRYVKAIEVNKEGHNRLLKMAEVEKRWSGIDQIEITNLSGYKALATIRYKDISKEDDIKVTVRKDNRGLGEESELKPINSADRVLVIADFEGGKDPLNLGGNLHSWKNGNLLSFEFGYYELQQDDGPHGKYAAYSSFLPQEGSDKWSGGGIVVLFKPDGASLNLEEYKYLQFDVRFIGASTIENIKVKLEDAANKSNRIELELSKFNVKVSDQWQQVRIPLKAFTKLNHVQAQSLEKVNLKAVTKMVMVSVKNEIFEVNGTLLIDNVMVVE